TAAVMAMAAPVPRRALPPPDLRGDAGVERRGHGVPVGPPGRLAHGGDLPHRPCAVVRSHARPDRPRNRARRPGSRVIRGLPAGHRAGCPGARLRSALVPWYAAAREAVRQLLQPAGPRRLVWLRDSLLPCARPRVDG